jgi:hypothetical protein
MKKNESIASFILRLFISSIILFAAFWYFDPINALKNETDSVNTLIYGIYVPGIFTGLTIIVCVIIGLPVRIVLKVNNWWYSNFGWQITILVISLVLLFLSVNMNFRQKDFIEINGKTEVQYFSNLYLPLTGWFLLAFVILHMSIPDITGRLSKKISGKDDWTNDPDR